MYWEFCLEGKVQNVPQETVTTLFPRNISTIIHHTATMTVHWGPTIYHLIHTSILRSPEEEELSSFSMRKRGPRLEVAQVYGSSTHGQHLLPNMDSPWLPLPNHTQRTVRRWTPGHDSFDPFNRDTRNICSINLEHFILKANPNWKRSNNYTPTQGSPFFSTD